MFLLDLCRRASFQALALDQQVNPQLHFKRYWLEEYYKHKQVDEFAEVRKISCWLKFHHPHIQYFDALERGAQLDSVLRENWAIGLLSRVLTEDVTVCDKMLTLPINSFSNRMMFYSLWLCGTDQCRRRLECIYETHRGDPAAENTESPKEKDDYNDFDGYDEDDNNGFDAEDDFDDEYAGYDDFDDQEDDDDQFDARRSTPAASMGGITIEAVNMADDAPLSTLNEEILLGLMSSRPPDVYNLPWSDSELEFRLQAATLTGLFSGTGDVALMHQLAQLVCQYGTEEVLHEDPVMFRIALMANSELEAMSVSHAAIKSYVQSVECIKQTQRFISRKQ